MITCSSKAQKILNNNNRCEKSLEAITKWLKKLGLKVNNEKTVICLFHCQHRGNVTVEVNGIPIKRKNMTVLGVLFDSELNWNHIFVTIFVARKLLVAMKLIKIGSRFNPNFNLFLI